MDGPAGGEGLADGLVESGPGSDLADADGKRPVLELGQMAHPDDVLDADVVPVEDIRALVRVDDGGQARRGETEEIEERAVLTVVEGVGRVVHRALLVSEKDHQARPDRLPQELASFDIRRGFEHVILLGGSFRDFITD
jgi:hypothetical protein